MSLLTTSVNTYSRDHELFRFPACKLALFIITTPIPRMTTSKIMLMIITLMLSRFTMKFIVFLLSLSDIRSLSQEKRDVNTFFIFFQYFFHFSLFFCTIINEIHPFHEKSPVFCCDKQVSHNIFLYFLFLETMCLGWQLLKPAVSIAKSCGRRTLFAQGIKSREISAQGNKLPGDNAQGSRGDRLPCAF